MKAELKLFFFIFLLRFPTLSLLMNFNQGEKSKAAPLQVDWQNWCQWDCKHYIDLANHYSPSAYFPAWPLLDGYFKSGLNAIFPVSDEFALIIFSVALSLIALRLALPVFEKFKIQSLPNLTFLNYSYQSWIGVILLCVFPSSFFWAAGYSESLLAIFWLAGILFFPERKFFSSILIGLTATVRPQGTWIVGTYGILLLIDLIKTKKPKPWGPFLLQGLCLLLPFCFFSFWLYTQTGNPLYFVEAQHQWGHEFSTLKWVQAHLPRLNIDFFLLGFSWYTLWKWRNRSFLFRFLAIVGVLSCEIPLFLTGFVSWTRYQSTNFALFISFSEICLDSPWIFFGAIFYSLPNLAIKIATWSAGGWAG
jgi:hypothetical protein